MSKEVQKASGAEPLNAAASAENVEGIPVATATWRTHPPLDPADPKFEQYEFADIAWEERPCRDDGPLDISVVVAFKKWTVDSSNGKEILRWFGVVELYWNDPRLVNYPVSSGMPENIFRPKTMGPKGFDLGLAESGKQVPKFGKSIDGLSDGSINLKVNFSLGDDGENLSDQLQRFKAFPFDSLRIDRSVTLLNPHTEGDTRPYFNLQLNRPNLKNRLDDGQYQHVDWTATRHCDDYALVNFAYAIGSNPEAIWGWPADGTPILCMSLQIARTPNFYVHKGIVPLYLVSFFGFLTYFLEPADLAGRISVLSALFLTVYAIQWVTIERLPRLPFSTVLDGVAHSVVVCLIMIVVGSCATYRAGRPAGGCFDSCDDFDMETAEFVDQTSGAVVAFYIVVYSFCYETVYKAWQVETKSGWSRPWNEGKSLGNKYFKVKTGMAFRLETTEEWFEKYGTKFIGEGTPVDAAIW